MPASSRPVSAADYRGKVVALYFGYSHCPDVCPTTLANLAAMAEQAKNPDLRILFVTVDPDRDTLPVLKQYAAAFSPQLDALSGTARIFYRAITNRPETPRRSGRD